METKNRRKRPLPINPYSNVTCTTSPTKLQRTKRSFVFSHLFYIPGISQLLLSFLGNPFHISITMAYISSNMYTLMFEQVSHVRLQEWKFVPDSDGISRAFVCFPNLRVLSIQNFEVCSNTTQILFSSSRFHEVSLTCTTNTTKSRPQSIILSFDHPERSSLALDPLHRFRKLHLHVGDLFRIVLSDRVRLQLEECTMSPLQMTHYLGLTMPEHIGHDRSHRLDNFILPTSIFPNVHTLRLCQFPVPHKNAKRMWMKFPHEQFVHIFPSVRNLALNTRVLIFGPTREWVQRLSHFCGNIHTFVPALTWSWITHTIGTLQLEHVSPMLLHEFTSSQLRFPNLTHLSMSGTFRHFHPTSLYTPSLRELCLETDMDVEVDESPPCTQGLSTLKVKGKSISRVDIRVAPNLQNVSLIGSNNMSLVVHLQRVEHLELAGHALFRKNVHITERSSLRTLKLCKCTQDIPVDQVHRFSEICANMNLHPALVNLSPATFLSSSDEPNLPRDSCISDNSHIEAVSETPKYFFLSAHPVGSPPSSPRSARISPVGSPIRSSFDYPSFRVLQPPIEIPPFEERPDLELFDMFTLSSYTRLQEIQIDNCQFTHLCIQELPNLTVFQLKQSYIFRLKVVDCPISCMDLDGSNVVQLFLHRLPKLQTLTLTSLKDVIHMMILCELPHLQRILIESSSSEWYRERRIGIPFYDQWLSKILEKELPNPSRNPSRISSTQSSSFPLFS